MVQKAAADIRLPTDLERMNCRLETRLRGVFLLSVEEPGDYLFVPAGVVILMEREQFQIFCVKSCHNLYRQVIYKFPIDELLKGVHYRDTGFRLEDISDTLARHGWLDTSAVPEILGHLYEKNPRHLFFLKDIVHTMQ